MRSEPADVALVTATSEDLPAAVQGGRFRDDLYHRLSVIVVRLPPLAERGTDILLLAEHFLARACADYGVVAKTLTPEARTALLAYPWPGNIRKLANVMEPRRLDKRVLRRPFKNLKPERAAGGGHQRQHVSRLRSRPSQMPSDGQEHPEWPPRHGSGFPYRSDLNNRLDLIAVPVVGQNLVRVG